MYSKEEIIAEIKRVAEKLGVQTLKRHEFEQNTTIPATTLTYHLGSWNRALKEAGLHSEDSAEFKSGQTPRDDDELLLELLRIHQETGETPTRALIESKSKFEYRHYGARWKSIGEAFMLARDRFPPKPRTITSSSSSSQASSASSSSSLAAIEEEPLDLSGLTVEQGRIDKTVPSIPTDFNGAGIYAKHLEEDDRKTVTDKVKKSSSIVEIPIAPTDPGDLSEDSDGGKKMIDKQQIKLIPQTIKPKTTKKKPGFLGEPVHFRGLNFAPANEKGVACLFGMIAHELGFAVEAFRTESPEWEGKRCLDTSNNTWEQVKVDFEFKSSDFNKYDPAENDSDLIVCWNHDWEECPIEVLELKSVIVLLEE
jgi:hypothetical protein